MRRILIVLLLLTALLAVGIVLAAPNSFNISWSTIDGGGSVPESTGGSYRLQGTAGQTDAGKMGNGRYSLNGGYWNQTMTDYTIYLPIVLKP